VLENVVFDSVTRVVDFDDGSKTENPIEPIGRDDRWQGTHTQLHSG
jgi:ATP-dependent phosphoenolpyruvate carboxykinase